MRGSVADLRNGPSIDVSWGSGTKVAKMRGISCTLLLVVVPKWSIEGVEVGARV